MVKSILIKHIKIAIFISVVVITAIYAFKAITSATKDEIAKYENMTKSNINALPSIKSQTQDINKIITQSMEYEKTNKEKQELIGKYTPDENELRNQLSSFIDKYNQLYKSKAGYKLSLSSLAKDDKYVNLYSVSLVMQTPPNQIEAQKELDAIVLNLQKEELSKFKNELSIKEQISIDEKSNTLTFIYVYKG